MIMLTQLRNEEKKLYMQSSTIRQWNKKIKSLHSFIILYNFCWLHTKEGSSYDIIIFVYFSRLKIIQINSFNSILRNSWKNNSTISKKLSSAFRSRSSLHILQQNVMPILLHYIHHLPPKEIPQLYRVDDTPALKKLHLERTLMHNIVQKIYSSGAKWNFQLSSFHPCIHYSKPHRAKIFLFSTYSSSSLFILTLILMKCAFVYLCACVCAT